VLNQAAPQCAGCSVTFQFLKHIKCGACLAKEADDDENHASVITDEI